MPIPYYDDPATLETLRKQARDDRVKWHARRVSKAAPVEAAMDRIRRHKILLDCEIQKALAKVREEIVDLETLIALKTDPRFQKLTKAINSLVQKYEESAKHSHETSLRWLRSKNDRSLKSLLAQLEREEAWVDLAITFELQLQEVCIEYGVDPRPYLKVSLKLKQYRGKTIEKLLMEHKGYKK